MWCPKCQQDVPAVAQQTQGPLVCTRCQLQLADANPRLPADSGIALDSFDHHTATEQEEIQTSPKDFFTDQESRQKLRRIGRQLKSNFQTTTPQRNWFEVKPEPAALLPEIQLKAVAKRAAANHATNKRSWQISVLLFCGIVGFFAGASILAWSAAFQLAPLWQWGMTVTITAEGLLMLGLSAMAIKLWRNSRRLNHQLSGVDRQLTEMQQQTGELAASQLSASQHYYNHFSQAASPHMLVANLRGQVDQLASRIAADV